MRTTNRPTALRTILSITPAIRAVHDAVRSRDRHLADQLKRAAQSVALNLSEADGNRAGTRRERLHSALGSLAETRTALELSSAWGYVPESRIEEIDSVLDQVAALTWRRLHPKT